MPKKASSPKNRPKQEKPSSKWERFTLWFKSLPERLRGKERVFLERRPHRSFRLTRRRDYVRSLKLPGYWALTNEVRKVLWQHKKHFLWLMFLYAVLTALLLGLASQDTYTQLANLLRQTSGDIFKGNWGNLGQASILVASGALGQFNASFTEAQQIYAVLLIFFTWLTTVWLHRAFMAGRNPKLRDALYSAGSPIIPTLLVGLLLVIQLLPIAVAFLASGVLLPFGLADGGAEAMLFWVAAALLALLSLYWITSTIIALVVVTLPGMYPMQAIRAAGDLVVGRRIRMLFRLLWLVFTVILGWLIVMVPIILLDAWIKGIFPAIQWLPIVPLSLLLVGTTTVVWVASYVYLFYRRVVNDDAAPA
ncbi:MAG TPA: hypothetical protein VIQ80_01830 [Candidatus Saccharimonadales bacterium]